MKRFTSAEIKDFTSKANLDEKMILVKDPSWPKISIVTPSYNQGKYIEATIQSVIGQNYPNLEYIIMDGGSQDNTLDIIKKYENHISYWESKKDNGQASAINRGFSIASGEIMAWLNSDDMYLPGTLRLVSGIFSKGQIQNDLRIIFGNCLHLYEEQFVARGSNVRYGHEVFNIELCDYIIQPSSFWTKKTFDTVGKLRNDLFWGFDWEWFIRAKRRCVIFHPIDDFLSVYRIHSEHKSGSRRIERVHELESIYKEYHPERISRVYVRLGICNAILAKNKVFRRAKLDRIIVLLMSIYYMCVYGISWSEMNQIRRM